MRILVAEDETNVAYMLRAILEAEGWDVTLARDGKEALEQFMAARPDVVITDLSMPRMDGLELLRSIRASTPGVPVILLTARGNERVAVDAIRAGAWDYFRKPFENAEVLASVRRAMEVARLREENALLKQEHKVQLLFDPQRSPQMKNLAETVERIAPKDVTVLITGETGTGKEVIARLLHEKSGRSGKPFVAFNCGALNESLVEAELFGWEKGAFTGAATARAGFFEQANGGTLLLDEIGDMTPSLQTKLLRVLQEGEVQRLGGQKPKKIDVRILSATHQDLETAIREKKFREDLFFRLNVVRLDLPPLRERKSDIPLLAGTFAARAAEKFDMGPVRLEEEYLAGLAARPWPGNVRELAHVIERDVALSQDGVLNAHGIADGKSLPVDAPLADQVDAFERGLLLKALEEFQWNQSATARALGLARVTLIDKMKKYNLRPAS
jgi:two-component system response regulator HydG